MIEDFNVTAACRYYMLEPWGDSGSHRDQSGWNQVAPWPGCQRLFYEWTEERTVQEISRPSCIMQVISHGMCPILHASGLVPCMCSP
jgi:hypothetical protein